MCKCRSNLGVFGTVWEDFYRMALDGGAIAGVAGACPYRIGTLRVRYQYVVQLITPADEPAPYQVRESKRH